MADLSVSGLATGIDTATLIANLMSIERQPEKLLTNQKSTIQKQIDVYNQLNTSLSNLQSAMAAMNTPATFMARSTSVGDSGVMTAQASSTALTGTHTVVVHSLAKFQRQVSAAGYASASDLNFRTGSLTISGGATPLTVAITQGNNSLNGIAAAINASGANLSASIVNDGSGTPYRLVLTGKDTKNYTIDTAGLTAAPTAPNGAVYANPSFPQSGATYSAGADASFSVDGIEITKSTNTVSDVITGVTLNLLKGGDATTTVTVNNDTAAVTTRINNFVSSYNDAMTIISKQSVYDTTTKKGGVLSGDSTLRSLAAALKGIVSTPVAGSGAYTVLGQIGIKTVQKDGTLTLDASKLSDALKTNFEAVSNLFTQNTGVPNLDANKYGVAEQFRQKLDKLTHYYVGPNSTENGIIATRIKGLNSRMADIDHQVEAMERLMTQKETSLKNQFASLESLTSTLTTQGNSLISILNKMSN